jgi:putative oxidoreductase
MKKLFTLDLDRALVLLRVTVAGLFMAHAAVRVWIASHHFTHLWNGSGGFSSYLASKGLPFSSAEVLAITAFELIGGSLLIAGRFTRVLAAGFFGMCVMGIILIHAQLGWFVGEHGEGGMEYSVLLCIALVVIAAADKAKS